VRVVTLFAVVIVTYALLLANGASLKVVDDDWAGADHSSIQDAIDDSAPGETIIVHDGEYSEDLTIDIPLTITGNGTSTEITAMFTAVIADDNLTFSGFTLTGTNGIDMGPDSIVTNVVIDISGSGTGISADERCEMINITLNGGSADLGPNCSVNSSSFDDVDIEIFGSGTTLTRSGIIGSTLTIASNGNLVYDNIIGGTSVDDPGVNSWNVTPVSGENIIGGDMLGGNFWYEYDGSDGNSDGIGDDPYAVDTDTSDMAPLMYLPTPPAILDADVTPLNGTTSTSVNFTLTYIDMNNDEPEYVRAIFQSMTINMTASGSSEPRNGTVYSATESLEIGNHTFHYEVSDGTSEVQSDEFTLNIFNSLPELFGSRDPTMGTVETPYNFSVMVRDHDDEAPTTVILDLDGTEYTMLPAGGGSPLTGLNYSITFTLQRGFHDYRFKALDPHSGENHTVNRTFEVLNSPPEILDVNVLNDQGVHRFTVSVQDPDGEEPKYARLMLDSKPELMTLTDSSEDTYEYQKRIYIEEGQHEYYVQVSDDIAADVSDVEPLNLTGYPALKAPGFNPDGPRSEQTVQFTVVYQDRDGRSPSYVRIYLNGVEHQMNLSGGDYASGAVFTYSEQLPRGTHTYSYNASNGEFINMTGNLTLEVLNTPPDGVLDVIPAMPGPDENITLTLSYEDVDGDDPVRAKMWLDGDQLNVTKNDLGEGAWSITASAFVDHGAHTVKVTYSDGPENRTIVQWLPADNAPEFDADVHNTAGKANVTVNVTATDIDGDPLDVALVLNGTRYPLTQLDVNDTNTTDGKNFTLVMSFPEGDHLFEIVVNDTVVQTSMPFEQSVIIKLNRKPILTSLDHSVEQSSEAITWDTPITFHVRYEDPDGDTPLLKLVLVQGDNVDQNLMAPTGVDPAYSLYEVTLFVPEGYWTYYAVANDGWGGIAVTENRTIDVQGTGTVEPSVEEDTQDYGPLQGLIDLLSDTTMLIVLVVVIVLIFAAAGAATRSRARRRAVERSGDERPAEEPPGYGPAPWDDSRAGYGPDPYGPGMDHRGPPREVEFTPEAVEFSPGSPPPEEVEEDEEDMEWHRPSPAPNAGPYVPSLGGYDDLDDYRPSHDKEWESLLDSTGFDETPSSPPAMPKEDDWPSDDDGWGSTDGWEEAGQSDSWADEGAGPSGGDAGGDAGPDDDWSNGFGSEDGAFSDETMVRHLDGEGTRRRSGEKERPRMGMFDDVEEVDISEWDF